MTANGGIMFYSLEFYLTHEFQKKINMYRPIFLTTVLGWRIEERYDK